MQNNPKLYMRHTLGFGTPTCPGNCTHGHPVALRSPETLTKVPSFHDKKRNANHVER